MAYPNDAIWWADLPIAPADPEEDEPEFEYEDFLDLLDSFGREQAELAEHPAPRKEGE